MRSVSFALLAVAASMLLGCGAGPTPSPKPRAAAAAETRSAAVTTPARPPVAAVAPIKADEPRRLRIREERGAPARERERVVAPQLRTQLEGCHAAGGGKLRVHVVRDAKGLHLDAEPDSSLDPTERQCVLEALRRDEMAAGLSTGATVPATGFTSLLTIEW